jgi:Leucine-rich repeat (LRR) protein
MFRNKITTIYPETFIYNRDLLIIDLGRNSITHIGVSTFGNNSGLSILNISVNNITSIDPDTFNYNRELQSVELQSNSISAIHVTTFGNNSWLRRLDISANDIAHFNHTSLFAGMNLTQLHRIRYLDKFVFRKQEQLETLILSKNMLQSLGSDLFTDCTNLCSLYVSGNNVTEITISSFCGLVKKTERQLECTAKHQRIRSRCIIPAMSK